MNLFNIDVTETASSDYRQFGKKHHRNRRNGSGDIVLRKRKTIEILRLWDFQSLFSTPGDTNGPEFSYFVRYLRSVRTKIRVWYIIRHIYCGNLKIRVFLVHFTVLPVFTIWGTVRERAVEEKNRCVFGFRMINFLCSNVVFHYLSSNLKFMTKLFFLNVTKFRGFLNFKSHISGTVSPISKIFLETDKNFFLFWNKKKESWRNFQN